MDLGSELLGKLYATAENPQGWTPLLDELRDRLGAGSAVVQLLKETPERLEPIWQARDTRSSANAGLHDRGLNNAANPRLHKHALAIQWGGAAPGPLIGSDRRAFGPAPGLMSEIRRRLAGIGLGPGFWISFPLSEARHFTLILHREPGDDRDLGLAEEGMLRELLPHMQRSARLRSSLDDAERRTSDLENAVDRLDLALMLCDADLRVQWVNDAAELLVARTAHLRIAGGKLEAVSACDNAGLRRMAGAVASGTCDSQVGVIAANHCDPIHVRASSGPIAPFAIERRQVSLFLSQPQGSGAIEPADLCVLFDLTPAEARLAAALAEGASLASYSAKRGIAVGTARNQVKQVLFKTGTRSQADLVRTLCNSAAARTRGRRH